MSKKLSLNEIQKAINNLPLSEVLHLLDEYSKNTHTDVSRIKRTIIINDIQDNLILNKINTVCPHCGSKIIVKNGKKNGTMMFKCRDCNKNFTLFTNTILEKTRYSWDVWVDMVWMTLNECSLTFIQNYLIDTYNLQGLNYKTVFMWRHKIIHALASMPMPKLSGVIQVDETFFRESQKGSHQLESMLKDYKRFPRHSIQHSKYGVMGNEFANVVTAVDNNGHAVAKVVGLGKLSISRFVDLFDEHISSASYLCTDKNDIYPKYADFRNIPLYIKVSTSKQSLKKVGYRDLNKVKNFEIPKQAKLNGELIQKLYQKQELDYLYNEPGMPYLDFVKFKSEKGLGLDKVNNFHSMLKNNLFSEKRNVSTKYLPDYISFETFRFNWKHDHNIMQKFSKSHAKDILIEILKTRTKYTKSDLNDTKINFPRATGKYMSLLKRKQAEVRRITKNKYFKFNPEDNVVTFNKLIYLEGLKKYQREMLRKKYKISAQWGKSAVCKELSKQPTIEEDIWQLINLKRGNNPPDYIIKDLKKLWGIK